MNYSARTPGIARDRSNAEDGLTRLRRQLASGARPSTMVLRQWVMRYGEAARRIIREHLPDFPFD
jgi:hypothetical protein